MSGEGSSAAHTLLLRLAGPMQSWGVQSRFQERDTGREPSKSGVVGLLCAALGRPREAPVADLAALIMGVRVDRPGTLAADYHTVGGTHRPGDRYGVAQVSGGTRTIASRRYYLADAAFMVGLQGPLPLLEQLDRALAEPVWPLYLGRRAFVPSEPVRLPDDHAHGGPGLRTGRCADVLRAYTWPEPRLGPRRAVAPPPRLMLVLDVAAVTEGHDSDLAERLIEVRRDTPVSFESSNRLFDARQVVIDWVTQPPRQDSDHTVHHVEHDQEVTP